MIYRSPERKPAMGRMASSRELALVLVVMSFFAAGVLMLANIPGQPRPSQGGGQNRPTATPDADLDATRRAPAAGVIAPATSTGAPGARPMFTEMPPPLYEYGRSPTAPPSKLIPTPYPGFGTPFAPPPVPGFPTVNVDGEPPFAAPGTSIPGSRRAIMTATAAAERGEPFITATPTQTGYPGLPSTTSRSGGYP